jgi:membrane dipeptidase
MDRGPRGGLRSPQVNVSAAIVIDGQGGIYDPYGADPYGTDPRVRFSSRAVDEMRDSGVTAISYTVNEVGNAPSVWLDTLKNIATKDLWFSVNSDLILKATSCGDIRRAKSEGRCAVIYNVQDTSLVGVDLERITLLNRLGVRVVQLTYNRQNLSGDGCLEPGNNGISELGRATIARIEEEKMLLDLSHSGQRTAAQAIAVATRPMTISHTGCRSLYDHPRNMWDEELKACADRGGVVGIYWTAFLSPLGHATSADLIGHMNHALDLCGEDHIAIGTDGTVFRTEIGETARSEQKTFYERRSAAGIAAPGEGPDVFNIVWDLDTHTRFHLLAEKLSRGGWNAAQIEKVLGGNLMRLYAEVWGA